MARRNRRRVVAGVTVTHTTKTTRKEVRRIAKNVQEQWTRGTQIEVTGGAENLARSIGGVTATWMASWGTEYQRAARTQVLKDMRKTVVTWLAPRAKGGRCRRAAEVSSLCTVMNAVGALYETFCGKKRTCDGLCTKYLPAGVQARRVRGPGYGRDIQEFLGDV